jgi:hypothetical protein
MARFFPGCYRLWLCMGSSNIRQNSAGKIWHTDPSESYAGHFYRQLWTGNYLFAVISRRVHPDGHSRILSPLYPALLTLGIGAMNRFFALNEPSARVRLAIGAFGAIVFLSQLMGTSSWLQLSYGNGIGYAGQQWRESPLADRVRRLDRSVPVFTNSPDALYSVFERPTYGIPAKVNPLTQLPNESYRAELASLRSGLQERHGVLVYFNTVRWR